MGSALAVLDLDGLDYFVIEHCHGSVCTMWKAYFYKFCGLLYCIGHFS